MTRAVAPITIATAVPSLREFTTKHDLSTCILTFKIYIRKKYLHNKQIQYHLRQQKTRSRYLGTSPGCPNDLTVNKSVRVTETPLYVHAPISSQRCVIYGSMI